MYLYKMPSKTFTVVIFLQIYAVDLVEWSLGVPLVVIKISFMITLNEVDRVLEVFYRAAALSN